MPEHIWSTGDAGGSPGHLGRRRTRSAPARSWSTRCTPNNIQYTANPTYWQPGKPYIQKVEYPAYLDNGPANLDLASGKAQWGSQFIPNIKKFYLAKSRRQPHLVAAGHQRRSCSPTSIRRTPATSKLAVRQAIATAIDRARSRRSVRAASSRPPTRPASSLPTFDKYFDAAALAASGYDKPNPDKAKAAAGDAPATRRSTR